MSMMNDQVALGFIYGYQRKGDRQIACQTLKVCILKKRVFSMYFTIMYYFVLNKIK